MEEFPQGCQWGDFSPLIFASGLCTQLGRAGCLPLRLPHLPSSGQWGPRPAYLCPQLEACPTGLLTPESPAESAGGQQAGQGRNLVDWDMLAVRNQVSLSHPGEPRSFLITRVSPVLVLQELVLLGSRGMATMPSREALDQGSWGGILEAMPGHLIFISEHERNPCSW